MRSSRPLIPALVVAGALLVVHAPLLAAQEAPPPEIRTGALEPGDPLLDGEEARWHDRHVFDAGAGERVTVELASADFDAWLKVILPSGEELFDDDGAGGTDSKLTFLATESGPYDVVAAAFGPGAGGAYEVRWSARPTEDFREHPGRLGGLTPKGQAYDSVDLRLNAGRILFQASSPSGAYLALALVDPDGNRRPAVGEGAPATLEVVAPAPGTWRAWVIGDEDAVQAPYTLRTALLTDGRMEVVRGELAAGDERLPLGEYVDVHRVRLDGPGPVTIELISPDFDTYLAVRTAGPSPLVERNDDAPGGGGTTSRVRFDADDVQGREGEWTIWVTSFSSDQTGRYEIRIVR